MLKALQKLVHFSNDNNDDADDNDTSNNFIKIMMITTGILRTSSAKFEVSQRLSCTKIRNFEKLGNSKNVTV